MPRFILPDMTASTLSGSVFLTEATSNEIAFCANAAPVTDITNKRLVLTLEIFV
jgi:hypothetical protein